MGFRVEGLIMGFRACDRVQGVGFYVGFRVCYRV